MPPIINGLIFGLLFVIAIGPAFFALIQTSVQRGFKPAFFLALGISFSDSLFVLLSLFGLSELLNEPKTEMYISLLAMLMLIVVGIYYWRKDPQLSSESIDETNRITLLKYTVKGLVLNGLNPFIIIFWITIISFISVNYDYSIQQDATFFLGVLITILATDIFKAFIAHRLKHMITPKIISNLNRVVGGTLILFSFRIFYFLLNTYWIS
jgi:threonine/homoserine/homoserine lactone efflux protein